MSNTLKATAIAPSNIAFIKYWGKKNQELKLPENPSISMTLDDTISTQTTVEFCSDFTADMVTIDGTDNPLKTARVIKHLDRIRRMAGTSHKAKVVSYNSFPSGTGISSSASGFAALSVAATTALGLDLSEKQLSILARQGSGSACRSIAGGFVQWLDGDTDATSFGQQIYAQNHWDIVDIVAVISTGVKDVSSTQGQKSARTSPFYQARLDGISTKMKQIRTAIATKNFTAFGKILEADALEMHAVMLTSHPSLIYWTEGTLQLMKLVKKWRKEGLEVYFTINTGQDTHLICEEKTLPQLSTKISKLPFIRQTLISRTGSGTRLTDNHLF